MTTALQQVLERIERLSEHLTPEEQATAAERLAQLADQLESDREWHALLATPESQAFLDELRAEALAEYAAGETIPGGWE